MAKRRRSIDLEFAQSTEAKAASILRYALECLQQGKWGHGDTFDESAFREDLDKELDEI